MQCILIYKCIMFKLFVLYTGEKVGNGFVDDVFLARLLSMRTEFWWLTSTPVYFPSEKEHQSYPQTKYLIANRWEKSDINVQILTDISYFGLRAKFCHLKKIQRWMLPLMRVLKKLKTSTIINEGRGLMLQLNLHTISAKKLSPM